MAAVAVVATAAAVAMVMAAAVAVTALLVALVIRLAVADTAVRRVILIRRQALRLGMVVAQWRVVARQAIMPSITPFGCSKRIVADPLFDGLKVV